MLELISRDEAREKSLKRFYTGIPCLHGHVCERYVINGSCFQCVKERALAQDPAVRYARHLAWKDRNPDAFAESQRKHQDAHKAEKREKSRLFRRENPEAARQSVAKYRAANKERVNAATQAWQRRNPERIAAYSAKRRAKLLQAIPKGLSLLHHQELIKIYWDRPERMQVDHIVPLNNPLVCGLHVPWNLQYLTPEENLKKLNSFDPDDPVQGNLAPRP